MGEVFQSGGVRLQFDEKTFWTRELFVLKAALFSGNQTAGWVVPRLHTQHVFEHCQGDWMPYVGTLALKVTLYENTVAKLSFKCSNIEKGEVASFPVTLYMTTGFVASTPHNTSRDSVLNESPFLCSRLCLIMRVPLFSSHLCMQAAFILLGVPV